MRPDTRAALNVNRRTYYQQRNTTMSHDAAEHGIQMSSGGPYIPDDDDDQKIEKLSDELAEPDPVHNHVTREVKPYGQCPACDVYHDQLSHRRGSH